MRLIIMPVVNSIATTEGALVSAIAQDATNVHVMAIDNGSTDGVGPWLRTMQSQRVLVVGYGRMVSLHKVWNAALDFAFNSLQLDNALVINNDVILRTDTYRRLEQDGGDFVTAVAVGTPEQMNEADPSSRSPHPSFSCFLITRKCWEKIGPFDERYWAYCGDLDYHIRMHRAGVDAHAIAVPFYHVGSATIRNASNAERDALQLKADADRATFFGQYGVHAGSPEYQALFSPKEVSRG